MVDDRLVTMQIWDTAGQVSESCYILGKAEATEIGPKFDFKFILSQNWNYITFLCYL